MRGAAGALALILIIGIPAKAETPDEPSLIRALPPLAAGTVATVPDGKTLVLTDGTAIRLDGIDAPTPPLGHGFDEHFPLADAAQETLSDLAVGQKIAAYGHAGQDRYGRVIAQVLRDDAVWLEAALVANGAVRVQTDPERRDMARALLRHEAEARDARRGIWRTSYYAVRPPDHLDHESGQFVIVEANVATLIEQHGALNLALSHGTLELHIPRSVVRLLPAAGLDPSHLANQPIRLRGWLRWAGHPIIDIDCPEQIELMRTEGE
jgi:endonuclease YncB( thermonuclease family)